MDRTYKIYNSADELAVTFADELALRISDAIKENIICTLAVSGGTTPKRLFEVMADKHGDAVDWKKVKIFWVDERCVSPDDPESNYGMTEKTLISRIRIPSCNVFRMKGEEDPLQEADRYSQIVTAHTRQRNNFPLFDIVLLGMGDDGHTASIFPDNPALLDSERICDTAVHPDTGQMRLTLTGKVINNTDIVFFLVTGGRKAEMVRRIFTNDEDSEKIPAANINSKFGKTVWLLDRAAGMMLP